MDARFFFEQAKISQSGNFKCGIREIYALLPCSENPKGFFCFASNWTVARDSRSESYPKSIEIKFKRRSCLLQEFDLKKCDSWETENREEEKWISEEMLEEKKEEVEVEVENMKRDGLCNSRSQS